MICKCENCTSALFYSPETEKLECSACGSSFKVSQYEEKTDSGEVMDMQIYSCTACGAKLAVNGVESSTFCSYCGQPTIVFDRVSLAKKPKYIIPFSVSKQKAVELIRRRMSKGFFIPNTIKNFKIEQVRGIYIPFWVYDVKYSDKIYLTGFVQRGKNKKMEYFYRHAETMFYGLPLDASRQLSDEVTQRLEPFFLDDKKEFATGYMSGFYADCFDVNAELTWEQARYRCRDLFDEEIIKSVRAHKVTIKTKDTKAEMINREYMMFPAWFLTFRYEDEPYTILVNGQTEKVVGAVPYDKVKMRLCFVLIAAIASICFFPFAMMSLFICFLEATAFCVPVFFVLGGGVLWHKGKMKIKQVMRSISLTKESSINHFVKNRQEE